jgi:hypothetical protein
MTRRRRGIAVGSVVLLLALLVAGWWFRDDIVGALLGQPEPVEVSPEAADAAEAKLRGLEDGQEARLSSIELSSLLRYRSQGWAAGTLREPGVRMSGEDVTITGIVPTDRLPSHPDLNAVRAFLPDSAAIEVHGRVVELGDGRAAFQIGSVEFAGLPIPERYFPEVLRGVGRRDEPGLAPNAVALRLPTAVSTVRVEDGFLILTP